MHFLCLAVMPRRISYYPDAFAGCNWVSSLGSMISILATVLFLYIVFRLLRGLDGGGTSSPWRRNTPRYVRRKVLKNSAANSKPKQLGVIGLVYYASP